MGHPMTLESAINSAATHYHRVVFLVGMGGDERADYLARLSVHRQGIDMEIVELATK